MKRLFIPLLLVLLPWGCNDTGREWPLTPRTLPVPVSVVSVEPARGWAGTLVKVVFHRESDSIAFSQTFCLNGYPEDPERFNGDTAWIRFPRVLTFTGLTLDALDRRTDSTYRLRVDFIPYPEICSEPVCVTWDYEDTVEESISLRYNHGQHWSTKISGDTVRLQISDIYPDSEFYRFLQFIDRGKNQLPSFLLYAEYGENPHINDTLREGLIKIDQWDPHGTISGAVFASGEDDPYFRFSQTYFFARLP